MDMSVKVFFLYAFPYQCVQDSSDELSRRVYNGFVYVKGFDEGVARVGAVLTF